MQTFRTRRARLVTSTILTLTLASTVAACGGDADGETSDGKTTITVATFNEFGYEDLIEEYNAMQDEVVLEQVKVGTWDDAKANLYTKLAAGSGLSDIEAIEGDAIAAVLAESDAFADLTDPELEGRWLDFVAEKGTNSEGQMIGYGTDVGPQGVCYRADLFEKAGLPTERDEVAAMMGTWEDYFATGEKLTEALPDTAWYDSSGALAQAMLNQVENPFEADDDTIQTDNPELQAVWEAVTGNSDTLSSQLAQWGDDWTASFQNDGFATTFCPGWMLGIIEGNAEGVEGWDIADVFPGGGGNWGGSYLTVPSQGDNIEKAQEIAAWLSAPEQQAKAFAAKGPFPSQVEALAAPEIVDAVNPYFNDAEIGQIYANRAAAITMQPYKGPKYSDILTAFMDAVLRVDEGSQQPDESWEQFQSDVDALG
ncbi:cellobiose transport system substrate-binding protein [Nocardioides alpinus]|uniref:Carbohydrate ABC transporter substrate-binding protein n=1 Tax=Nocardioides alpinus TaxID=748909 RepID=A0A1I0WKP7_9ACTN|nr:ABC transporter substrate-binding protein [Nocardioides alpinus]PKH38113.1 carbohydrate ABC transporter substrate-binding protein [Nocardioides alpinus]SFA89191.1 cellobiose transport system substrate-binding protein [Nocardioides alpinus]